MGLGVPTVKPVFWTERGAMVSWTVLTTAMRTAALVSVKCSRLCCHLLVIAKMTLNTLCWFSLFSAENQAYKVQNLQWTPDFLGAITLTWSRPKNLPLDSCNFLISYRSIL